MFYLIRILFMRTISIGTEEVVPKDQFQCSFCIEFDFFFQSYYPHDCVKKKIVSLLSYIDFKHWGTTNNSSTKIYFHLSYWPFILTIVHILCFSVRWTWKIKSLSTFDYHTSRSGFGKILTFILLIFRRIDHPIL